MKLKKILKCLSGTEDYVFLDGFFVASIKNGKISTGHDIDYSEYQIVSIHSELTTANLCIDIKPPKVKKSCVTCLHSGLPITSTRCRTCLTDKLTLWEKGSGL